MVSEAVKPLTVPKEFLGPPKGFNPTLLVFVLAIGVLALSVTGYLYWHLPAWCCFVLNTIALHVLGTVVHDACHDSAHGDRFMNGFMGQVSAFLICTTFPVFTRVHMQHHAHVNHPEDDPDHYVSHGGPLLLIAPRFFYHEVFFLKRRLWIKNEFYEWLVARVLLIAIVAFAIYRDGVQEGAFSFLMTFWFLPAMVVGTVLGLFFDYLPHRPFQERDRWKNARVYPNQLLNWLIMGQNYHLVHHLWPSIPWYQYQPAYYAVKPLLDEKGCHQTIGLWDRENFWPFVYDIFVGIHRH